MNKLLKDTKHRPFPLPSKRWIIRQRWRNVSFIHWPISTNRLRSLVPSPLEIDHYDGQAWVGIIGFEIKHIHLRGAPLISLTPRFPEVNVRTYVTYNGVPGIYFLSIDVDNWASNTIAKRWYRLPYHPANLSVEQAQDSYHYEMIRKGKAYIIGKVTPSPPSYVADKKSLDYWLMERYRLYSSTENERFYKADIHHKQWPLQKAQSEIYQNTLISNLNIGLNGYNPVVTHFSKGVDTLIWNIKKL